MMGQAVKSFVGRRRLVRFNHGADVLHQAIVPGKPEPEHERGGEGYRGYFEEFRFHEFVSSGCFVAM